MSADELINTEDATEEILWWREFLKCPKCEKGYFYPTEEYKNNQLEKCYGFRRNKCGLVMHADPADVTVD